MKNKIRICFICFIVAFVTIKPEHAQSQPDPPKPPAQHGFNGNPSSTGAPLTGGPELLILFGLIYGSRVLGQVKKKS